MFLPKVKMTNAAIAGTDDLFPIRRIYCVALNYADHVREMGADPDRAPPFFFSKPADAIVPSGSLLPFPSMTSNLHHEIELVVALGTGGSDVKAEEAEGLIFGYAVGLDLTRRDLQAEAKNLGRPWDMAKGFDHSAPLGAIKPGIPPREGSMLLTVDGQLRQSGNLSQMIWSVPEIISLLSTFVKLEGGDLIFTGTPAGVGPILPGEKVHAAIEGLEPVEICFAG